MTAASRAEGCTVIYVAYRVPWIDLTWIPDDAPVRIVHNDTTFETRNPLRATLRHLGDGTNVGFGAGVNLALADVTTPRVAIVNPDIQFRREHWTALAQGAPDEIVTVPLVDGTGRPTHVVQPYPTPMTLLATVFEVGRLLPRGSRSRGLAERITGTGTKALGEDWRPQVHSITDRWVSGAAFSIDTALLRGVGGFDPQFFLYFEDVDLCRRLAQTHPQLRVRLAAVPAAVHAVGRGRATRRMYSASAARYARGELGVAWRLAAAVSERRA